MKFQVFVTDIDADSISFQIKFENPALVSYGESKDILIAIFKDEVFFSRTDSPISIVENTKVFLDLPKMFVNERQEKMIKIASSTLEATK